MEINEQFWKPCSSCKKSIGYNLKYYECSVSTCAGKRTGYVFCSVFCWERHLPGAKHRDAAAIEKKSPTLQQWKVESSTEASTENVTAAPRRIIVSQNTNTSSQGFKPGRTSMDQEVLVVVSKMKTYIKEKADMNTAGEVSDTLSEIIRRLCDDAIDKARADGRKTVMSRDFN